MWRRRFAPPGAHPGGPRPNRCCAKNKVSGQLRKDADLDLVLDLLYGPLYYRFLVKNDPPSQKYAEAVVELLIQALERFDHN